MTEIVIKVPDYIKDLIDETTESIYLEALREVARKKRAEIEKKLKQVKKEISIYEKNMERPMMNFLKVFLIIFMNIMIG